MIKYNIVYEKTIDFSVLLSTLNSIGGTVESHFESLHVLNISIDQETDFSSITGIILSELDSDISVEPSADFWHKLRIVTESLPMRNVYTPKNTGIGSVVYVVDSGVDSTHSQLQTANITNLYSYDGTFTDTLGHGTQIISLIVGNTLGVSQGASIKVVKIPFLEQIPISSLLSAFDTILQDHNNSDPAIPKIVNCSWIVSKSQILDTKITELQSNNLVVVAAAGNGAVAANDYSPVGLNTVIGVGASDAYDRVINWGPNSGSNWGPEVDITAPGIDIDLISTTGSGTSLAAAIVSGVVCQFISDDNTLSAQQVQTNVINFATNDILFRNESIYGTTPNRLLRTLSLGNLFGETPKTVDVQKGTTEILVLDIDPQYISSVEMRNTTLLSGVTLLPPEWASITGNALNISPDANIIPGKYRIRLHGLNDEQEQVTMFMLVVNVYEISPTENEQAQEVYPAVDENGMIIIFPATCFDGCAGGTDIGCASGGTKGSICGCSGDECLEE